MSRLTHLDETGRPRMVDVSAKEVSERRARAEGQVRMDAKTLAAVLEGPGAKGDVLRIAELAGIMAAKRTGDLIPLCHTLPLTSVRVRIDPDPDLPGMVVSAEAKISGRTGVEMEALTAVSIACLTLYDMLKARARGIVIERIMLVEKEGGASGHWRREPC